MNRLNRLGRSLFAVSLVGFGIQHLIYATMGVGLGPPWVLGRPLWAYLTGIALIAVSGLVVLDMKARIAAALFGAMMLLLFLLFYVPLMITAPHDGGVRSSAFEILAIAGAALVLSEMAEAGRYLFGIAMVVFGIDHFIYAAFIATLVPWWIPGHLFWAYATGALFIVGGICIAIRRYDQVPAALLGAMFLGWVLTLHGPRVAFAYNNGNEWTSALVALSMCGGAWLMTGARLGKSASKQSVMRQGGTEWQAL